MGKPAFQNLEIDFWVYQGKLGVTRESICLFHADLGQGAQILNAITDLSGENPPAQRMLTFKSSFRKMALRKLKLKLVPPRDDLRIMHIGYDRETAIIEMTGEGLSLLRDGFGSWLGGAEDFGVSPRSSSLKPKEFGMLDRSSAELWFWGPGYEP